MDKCCQSVYVCMINLRRLRSFAAIKLPQSKILAIPSSIIYMFASLVKVSHTYVRKSFNVASTHRYTCFEQQRYFLLLNKNLFRRFFVKLSLSPWPWVATKRAPYTHTHTQDCWSRLLTSGRRPTRDAQMHASSLQPIYYFPSPSPVHGLANP